MAGSSVMSVEQACQNRREGSGHHGVLQLDVYGLNRNAHLLRDGRPNVHVLGIGLDAYDQRIAGSESTPVPLRLLLPPLHGIHADKATLRQLCRVASPEVAVKRATVPELIAKTPIGRVRRSHGFLVVVSSRLFVEATPKVTGRLFTRLYVESQTV